MTIIHFDKLYIPGPTDDQYDDMTHGNVEFFKDIKNSSQLINYQEI